MKKIVFLFFVFILSFSAVFPVFSETISILYMDTWSGLKEHGFFTVGFLEDPGARAFRRDLLLDGLLTLKPDIIALTDINPLPKESVNFAELTEYDALYSISRGGVRIGAVGLPANLRSGSLILADPSFGLTETGTEILHGGTAGNTVCLQGGQGTQVYCTEITVEETTIFLFVANWTESILKSPESVDSLSDRYFSGDIDKQEYLSILKDTIDGREKRLKEAQKTVDFINRIAGQSPVILVGTFNSVPGSDEIGIIQEAGFYDIGASRNESTWDPEHNTNIAIASSPITSDEGSARIDYCFIRGPKISGRSIQIVFDKPVYSSFTSDHYGILMELNVSP